MLKKHAAERMKKFKVPSLKGDLTARGARFGIVVAEFNEFLTERLLEGALDTLLRSGARPKDVLVVHVPGAFEIPLAASRLLKQKKLSALITLAVVIKGKTKHFDQVVRETAKGVRELSMKSGVPVILGMVAADSIEDAAHRVGLKQANKGREWAVSAVQMASLMRKLGKVR